MSGIPKTSNNFKQVDIDQKWIVMLSFWKKYDYIIEHAEVEMVFILVVSDSFRLG